MKSLSKIRGKIPQSGIFKLQTLAAKCPEAIRLETGEPDFNTPENICNAACKAANDGFTKYTSVPGYMSLRDTIRDDLNKTYEFNIDSDEIVVTAGATMAIYVSLMAIADPGDEILFPDPSWPVYEMLLISEGLVPVSYNLNPEDGFLPDFDELQSKITEKTKAIMINNPGNPTGAIFEKDTIKKLIDFAVKNDIYIISDEVYDTIIFEGKHVSAKTFDTDGRVICVMGVSKKYAMTGWRIGYAIANKEITSAMNKVMVTVIGNASSISQKAVEAGILGSQEFVEKARLSYKNRRDKAYEIFIKEGIKVYYPKAAFYMLVDISETGMPSEEFAITLLEEEKVSVAPGDTFGKITKNMIRISLATEESILLQGVQRISNFINRKKK